MKKCGERETRKKREKVVLFRVCSIENVKVTLRVVVSFCRVSLNFVGKKRTKKEETEGFSEDLLLPFLFSLSTLHKEEKERRKK